MGALGPPPRTVPWAHTVAAPAPEQSAEAGEATVTASGANAMTIPKISLHCFNCTETPSVVWRPAATRACTTMQRNRYGAERKSAPMTAQRIRDFKPAFFANERNLSRGWVNS
jgi:hypothetical protein